MSFWAELGLVLHRAIRQGRLSIEELAREIGVSPNLLYQNARYFLSGQGKSPTLETALLCMERQRDFRLLKLICRRFGFRCIRHLPYPKNHDTNLERLLTLHDIYTGVTALMTQYIKDPADELREHLCNRLEDSADYEMALVRSYRQRSRQLDLFERDV